MLFQLVKITTFLISWLFVGSPAMAQIQPNNWATQVLKGNVRSLSAVTYKIISKPGERRKTEKTDSTFTVFNVSGNIIEAYRYAPLSNIPGGKTTYRYDSTGNYRVEEKYTSHDGSSYKNTYRYDSKWNLMEMNTQFIPPSTYANRVIYEYDGNRNLIKKTSYLPDNRLSASYTYTYDNKSNKVEEIWYRSDGTIGVKYRFEYDDKDNKITETVYGRDGTISNKAIHKYDENKNRIESNNYNPLRSQILRTTMKYDSKRNIIEMSVYNADGNLTSKMITEYDANENSIGSKTYDSNNSILRREMYNYEYDKNKNWIRKTGVINDVPNFFSIRKISYF